MTDKSPNHQYSPSPIDSVRSTTREFVERQNKKRLTTKTGHESNGHGDSINNTSNNDLFDNQISHVWLDESAIDTEISSHPSLYFSSAAPSDWAQWFHYRAPSEELTVKYILVLDALNFCFWPLEGYEYAQLASSLKFTLQNDDRAFDAERLINLKSQQLEEWLQPLTKEQEEEMQRQTDNNENTPPNDSSSERKLTVSIPLLESRCRALNELGYALINEFEGSAAKFVSCANHSAARLVSLITSHFPAFRDHGVDPTTGSQCFFYKRAQICVADLWGAFSGRGFGQFDDINDLTCFADYRIPQLLSNIGIMKYSEQLKDHIENHRVIPAGSEVELSIRAHTVQAVELMRESLKRITGHEILSIQLDWILWERGEANLKSLQPHHRTRTIYY